MGDPIVGIDLGTSNTVVACATASGTIQVLADTSGYKIHPSVVSFHPSGGVVVGAAAKQRKVIDPKNTIFSTKRLIGRPFNSPEVQTARSRMPYQIVQGQNQLPLIVTRGGEFAVPEISAIVLDHAKQVATTAIGSDVSRAVVTVPASFNEAQRSATATAGSIAGLTVVRVLNEPTAAALAYGHSRNLRETIAVYDFGGGTFDITILKLAEEVYEVLGTSGDTFLGGDDLDERIVEKMADKFLAEQRVDLRMNEVSMMRMRAVAEQTKIELTRRARALVRIDEIAYGANGKPLDLQIEIRRDDFIKHIADIVDRTFPVCEEALRLAQLTVDHIDDVILVGGTTKIPYVRDQVARFFAKAPRTDVNPEDAVACGAALQASAMERILGKTPSRPPPPPPQEPEVSVARPGAEPARSTGSYSNRRHARPASKGEHRDTFEDRTPPPVSPNGPVLARLTKPAPPRTPPPVPTPRTTQPIPPPRPPAATEKKPPAGTLRGVAPRSATFDDGTEKKLVTVEDGDFPDTATLRFDDGTEKRIVTVDDGDFHDTATLKFDDGTEKRIVTVDGEVNKVELDKSLFDDDSVYPSNQKVVDLPLPASVPARRTAALGSPAPLRGTPPTTEPSPAATAKGFAPMPKHPVVMDVTPRGLGIATVAGFCEELIRRNSRVPTEIRKLFTTSRDQQDSVRIIVCQGESRRLHDNIVIGDLRLENLPPRPRGETSIEVTFMLDASGILQVRARDAQTGREQRASLDIVGTMTQEDIAASRERLQSLRR